MSWLRGAALALILCSVPPVQAAPQPPEKNRAADLRTARELYDKGITAYNLGEYDNAIAQLKRSYELSNAAQLLFNIAQAYRAKGDHAQALNFYRTYMRLVPNARNRADAETLALEMERKAAEDEHAKQEREQREEAARREASQRAANEAAQRRAADEAAQREAATRRVAEESQARAVSPDAARLTATAPPPRKPLYKKWWFWTAVGGAAAVAATATAVAVTVGSRTVTPAGNLGTIDGRP